MGIGHFQMRSFPFPVMASWNFVFFCKGAVREPYAIVRASLGRSEQVGQRGGPLYRSILPTSGPRLMIGVTFDIGATHAWTEIYIPGAGWHGLPLFCSAREHGTRHGPVAIGVTRQVPPATYESAGYRSADAFPRDDANIDVCASLHLPSYSLV